MKIEVEIPDDTIRATIEKATHEMVGVDNWGRLNSSIAGEISNLVKNSIIAAFGEMDISGMIRKAVDAEAAKTIQVVIAEHIKTEARKALKAQLAKPADADGFNPVAAP